MRKQSAQIAQLFPHFLFLLFEPGWVTPVQLINVGLGNLIEGDVSPFRNLRQVPQNISHLMDQFLLIQLLATKGIILHQVDHLARLTGQTQRTIG